jgi:hypothetical protein
MAGEKKAAPAINLNPSHQMVRYLETLRRSGLYGNQIGVVARTLVQDAIKDLIKQGSLKMEFDPGDDSGADD